MLWRCWASSEHGIARPATDDRQACGNPAGRLKLSRACGGAAIACPVALHTDRASLRVRSVQRNRDFFRPHDSSLGDCIRSEVRIASGLTLPESGPLSGPIGSQPGRERLAVPAR